MEDRPVGALRDHRRNQVEAACYAVDLPYRREGKRPWGSLEGKSPAGVRCAGCWQGRVVVSWVGPEAAPVVRLSASS